ncbi:MULTISPECIES: hypothetical protein [Microbacterium]|uniref:Uncharacterized protein n=2 Tax=Microbacterium wangchenii TaxID=2541726 RepID=A0ABX5SUN5_9MICO|nr:hypothetical protein [Microbacterium sp. EYE_512]MCK6067163.1 hypothetical protein [Microbacterium sp. EYE_512]QBR89881.1 hypothetical protein E4K62_15030 [Microbacterium wangchenii]
MFGIYAAEVQFQHDSAERDRALRRRALRAERLIPERVLRPLDPPAAPRRAFRGVWPRPVAVPPGSDAGFRPRASDAAFRPHTCTV